MSLTFVLDLETTGLLQRGMELDDPSQPRIVQAAGFLLDEEWNEVSPFSLYVRPEDWSINVEAEGVHGISMAQASRMGQSEVVVLGLLVGAAACASRVVGHGVEFDRDIVTGSLMRLGKSSKIWRRPHLEWVDTMKVATHTCKIPKDGDDSQYKWPKLDEACEILLGQPPREEGHDALDDARRSADLYRYLVEQRMIETA